MFSNKNKILIIIGSIIIFIGIICFLNYYCDSDNVGKSMVKEIVRAIESGDEEEVS